METRTTIPARFYGYCRTCHFSIFRGEHVLYDGTTKHLDCQSALSDSYPRRLDPKYQSVYGDVRRAQMRALLAQRASTGCEAAGNIKEEKLGK